jgi:hypothetical protein
VPSGLGVTMIGLINLRKARIDAFKLEYVDAEPLS